MYDDDEDYWADKKLDERRDECILYRSLVKRIKEHVEHEPDLDNPVEIAGLLENAKSLLRQALQYMEEPY